MIEPVSGFLAVILPFLPFWVSAEVNAADHWDKTGKTNRLFYRLHTLYPTEFIILLCPKPRSCSSQTLPPCSLMYISDIPRYSVYK